METVTWPKCAPTLRGYEGSAVIRDLISKPIELGRVAVLSLDRIAAISGCCTFSIHLRKRENSPTVPSLDASNGATFIFHEQKPAYISRTKARPRRAARVVD